MTMCTCNHQLQPHDRLANVCPPARTLPSEPDPNATMLRPGVWLHWGLYLRGAQTPFRANFLKEPK